MGKVVKGFGVNDMFDCCCIVCMDECKDQFIKGMMIIKVMKKDGDYWDGGNIFDLENGKVYKCKMMFEDGGQKFVVCGYIGVLLFGCLQIWVCQ